ncbi:MAG: M3 family oligoendopeptidase [Anaerolineales bacterium]|nr:M3 family oligoendopeptidase [Anaerolineales bacterium]
MTKQYQQTLWSLDDLLSATSGPAFDQIKNEMETFVAEMESWRERLSSNIGGDDFLRIMTLYEKISEYATRMVGYGRLWFASDTQSQEALGFMGRMDQLFTEVRNRLLFFDLWWKQLEDEAANRLMRVASRQLYFLESLRRFKPYTLSEPEEKIINLKDVNGVDALTTIYDMITNKYVFELEVDGEVKKLTRDQLAAFVHHPSSDLREAAYREMLRVFSQDASVLGQIYMHRVRDWRNENLTVRHYESPIAVRNLGNDIPDPVVDTLLEVCQQNASIFQDYFRLKAGWLGMEKLRRFDVYAPLSETDTEYPFTKAVETVLDSFERFSPIIAQHAERVFSENHIDSEIRPGKEGGAFCAGMLPGAAPWVKLNYTGKVRDVATMAHELGHAIHALMAAGHSILTFQSSLPLAETASVFGEMILTERLLEEMPDPKVQRNILATAVDDAYATVMRQAFFVLFERQAHAMIAEGKTIDELRAAYLQNLYDQFGDALDLDEGFQWEWVAIPHIYQVPFYCYAYSFGQLLVLSLYQRYKEEGPSFIPSYLKILAYGGSASPDDILTEAGIDMTSADFWQGGFDVIRGMVDRLAAL